MKSSPSCPRMSPRVAAGWESRKIWLSIFARAHEGFTGRQRSWPCTFARVPRGSAAARGAGGEARFEQQHGWLDAAGRTLFACVGPQSHNPPGGPVVQGEPCAVAGVANERAQPLLPVVAHRAAQPVYGRSRQQAHE